MNRLYSLILLVCFCIINTTSATRYFMITDVMVPGVENGDVDDLAALVGAVAHLESRRDDTVTALIADMGGEDKRYDEFVKFARRADNIYTKILRYSTMHPERLSIRKLSDIERLGITKDDVILVHSSIPGAVLKFLANGGFRNVYTQGQNSNDFNWKETAHHLREEYLPLLEKVFKNGRDSGETSIQVPFARIKACSKIGEGFRDILSSKISGQAFGIGGFVERFLDAFYVPGGNPTARYGWKDASSIPAYEHLRKYVGAAEIKDAYNKFIYDDIFQGVVTAVKGDKQKGNNFLDLSNAIVIYAFEKNQDPRKIVEQIHSVSLSEKVKRTIHATKENPETTKNGVLAFTFVVKAAQFIFSKGFVDDTFGDRMVGWLDVAGKLMAHPGVNHEGLKKVLFEQKTPPLWDLAAFQMAIIEHSGFQVRDLQEGSTALLNKGLKILGSKKRTYGEYLAYGAVDERLHLRGKYTV